MLKNFKVKAKGLRKKSAVLLAMILAAAIFVSCAQQDDAGTGAVDTPQDDGRYSATPDIIDVADDDAAEAARIAEATPNLPDVNFEGYEFRILNTENDSVPWLLTVLEAEELTGDVFNDAVYHRNRAVEERLGINIAETLVPDFGQVRNRAQNNIRAGSDEFDLYMLNHNYAFTLAQEGMLVDFNDIPNIDLSRAYWDQGVRRDLSINNRLFTMTGDFSFTHYSSTLVMFFNKAMHADHGLENPYQMVRDGRWTFDAFHQQARDVPMDLDGNGIFDHNDQFGYMSLYFLIYPTWVVASGERYFTKDADDRPVIAAGSERWATVFHSILDIMHDGNLLWDARDYHRHQDIMFPNNQVMFWSELMNWARILREMENDFGILPHPKFNEAQENYYSIVFGFSFQGVPITTPDTSRTGVILEALNAQSRLTTMPVYYDVVLQTMTARDDESGEMLDIIFANRVYDLGLLFFEGLVVSPFNQMALQNNRDVSGVMERNEPRIEAQIQRVMDRFDELW